MDHLGIRQFFFFGNCIGGPFAMKLMERAPQRVVAALGIAGATDLKKKPRRSGAEYHDVLARFTPLAF